MNRRTFTAAVTIDGQPVGTATKYAHNTAKRAGEDFLRDARGTWEITGSERSEAAHTIRYASGERTAEIRIEEVTA